MLIREARLEDAMVIARIFRAVVATGDTYSFDAGTTDADAAAYFLGNGIVAYVAEDEGRLLGVYKLIPNHVGRGSHVANASFMVDPAAQRKGIGRALGEHCLEAARRQGYEAMQFNFVVSTNTAAVELWKKLGFNVVGTLPKAFDHAVLGKIDAYVMHRFL